MKKIISYSLACLVIGIVASSCESNLSITKRHYTNGYYVDYNKNNKATVPLAKNAENMSKEKPVNSVSSVNSVENNTTVNNDNSKIGKVASPLVIPNPMALVSKKLKTKKTIASNQVVSTSADEENLKNVNETKGVQKIATDASAKMTNDEGERAALSLLWLVIVVVLIVWLIGILAGGFGLGGFINLLLVVALILLILWLLRIA